MAAEAELKSGIDYTAKKLLIQERFYKFATKFNYDVKNKDISGDYSMSFAEPSVLSVLQVTKNKRLSMIEDLKAEAGIDFEKIGRDIAGCKRIRKETAEE